MVMWWDVKRSLYFHVYFSCPRHLHHACWIWRWTFQLSSSGGHAGKDACSYQKRSNYRVELKCHTSCRQKSS
ncbi:hypothetical protein NC651_003289 [Populus alba x Populus x berolinensis]|nr:hypothetical protein NC651_003289 [Populus alba x Populus x berolinensis]